MTDSVSPGSEVLQIGRATRRGHSRRGHRRPGRSPRSRRVQAWAALGLAALLLLAAAGLLLHRALQPPPPFTSTQLHQAYVGMSQRNGMSFTFPIGPDAFGNSPITIDPADCRALFATTVAGRFPADGLDGVSAYWLVPGGTVELFTVRYRDTALAAKAYAQVSAAVQPCRSQPIRVSDRAHSGTVLTLPASPGSILPASGRSRRDRVQQIAYLLDLGDQGKVSISATQLRNTVTWQYRNERGDSTTAAWALQSLNDAFVVQLLASASGTATH